MSVQTFPCERCGACCRNLRLNTMYKTLDRGDGVCRHFLDTDNSCAIYNDRPQICRVDSFYLDYYKDLMSIEEYYRLNKLSCIKLRRFLKKSNKYLGGRYMFLYILNNEDKQYFGNLIKLVAESDGEIAILEQDAIDVYQKEMGLEQIEQMTDNLDSILQYFSTRSDDVKNAVFIETLALVFADNIYAKEEQEVITKLVDLFKIPDTKVNECIQWVKDIQSLYKRGYELIQS
jgi:Fe-S-cluster containining protein